MDIKHQVLHELDSRLQHLTEHRDDIKPDHGNQYERLNHAISSVIGESLGCELQSLRDFVDKL